MDDSTKKALTQVVLASLQNAKKRLKADIVISDGVFKNGEQILMAHEIAEMILPWARKSLDSKGDYIEALAEIISSIPNGGGDESMAASPFPVPVVPKKRPLPEFEDCFSEKTEAFIKAKALDIGVKPDGVVGSVLAVLSAAIPVHCRISVSKDYSEHATLWVALVGKSSSRKTPTLKSVMKFFEHKQKEFVDENFKALAEYKKKTVKYECELQNYRKNMHKNQGMKVPDEPEKVGLKLAYLTDATIEAMTVACGDNPRGILYFKDELSNWVGKLNRPESEGERSNWLEGFNAGKTELYRIGRGYLGGDCFRVTILGGLQPVVIKNMINDKVVDGMVSRFILVEQALKGYATNEMDPRHSEYLKSIQEKLFDLPACQITMSPEALEFYAAICKRFADELETIKADSHWRAFYGKFSGIFLRIALVFHLVDVAERNGVVQAEKLSLSVLKRAHRFCENFVKRSAMAIYSAAGAEIPELGDGIVFSSMEKIVLNWLKDRYNDGIKILKKRDLERGSFPYRKMTDQEKKAFIQNLSLSDLAFITTDRDSFSLQLSPYICEVEL